MNTLPARTQGALGLATVKVMGVDNADCLDHMRKRGLEFLPGCYSNNYDLEVTKALQDVHAALLASKA